MGRRIISVFSLATVAYFVFQFDGARKGAALALLAWHLGGFLLDELFPTERKGVKNKTTQPKKLYPPCTLALLTIFIKDEEYDDFFEHFDESFEKRRQRSGLTAARLWVWKQVFLTIGPLVWRVIRGAVAVWKLDEIWKKFI